MRVLLTGATGFIGRRLADHLVAEGHETHALLRATSDASSLQAAIHCHRDTGALDALLASIRPDAVLHLATRYQHGHAHADIEPLLEANIVLGARLADAAGRSGVRAFVALGTGAQHTGVDGTAPATLYAASKQAFAVMLDTIARTCGLPTATLILFDTFGGGDTRGKILDRFIDAARTGTSLSLSPGEQAIDLVHVDDVIDAILLTVSGLRTGALQPGSRFVLSSGTTVTLRALAALVGTTLHRPVPARWGALPYRPGEIMLPWRGGTTLPGWQPSRSLAAFIAEQGGGAP